MLKNPTNIDIDAQGRIWVTEGVNYRRHKERDPKGDRVVVLEDTDGDGRADKSTAFVQEPTLVAPLGIAVIGNKVIVSNAPDLIVYTDVDGDRNFDPAVDKREVLLTGFDGRNHDHALHSVTFGPDGRWYFSQGNAGAYFTDRGGKTFRVGSAYNPVPDGGAQPVFGFSPPSYAGAKSDDGHVYVGGFSARMQPDGTGVEILGFNFRNSYEQTVTSFGDIFHNDNDDPPACRTTYLMEYGNLGFFSRDGKRSWHADRRPGQSIPTAEWRQEDPGVIPSGDVYGGGAPTGIVFNEGDGLGKKWRGLLLSAEAARNTIFGYFPKARGRGLSSSSASTSSPATRRRQFAGTDFKGGKVNAEIQTFFRPSDVAVGPDGAIYVADWFDPRVGGHDDKDDTTSGAIYRIAPKGFKPRRARSSTRRRSKARSTALRSPAVNVRALGFDGARRARRGRDARGRETARATRTRSFARAPCGCSRASGPRASRASRALLGEQRSDDARRGLSRAAPGGPRAARTRRALARDPSPAVRREVALSLRDVPFDDVARRAARARRRATTARIAAISRPGASARRARKTRLYAALARLAARRDAAQWPAHVFGSRLAPHAARGGDRVRGARAARRRCPRANARRRSTALGFIPDARSRDALARHRAARRRATCKQNPALWWLLNYKDSRWADAGIDAELKRRGLFDPDAVTVSEVTVPAPAADFDAAGGRRHRETARQREARRDRRRRLPHVPSHRRAGRRLRAGARRIREPPDDATSSITAIVNPSNDIAHGYEGTEITLDRRPQDPRPRAERRQSADRAEHGRRHADDPRAAGQGAQAARPLADAERRAVRADALSRWRISPPI